MLRVVSANSALRLKAELDFKDGDVCYIAGDEWLFKGPGEFAQRGLNTGIFLNGGCFMDVQKFFNFFCAVLFVFSFLTSGCTPKFVFFSLYNVLAAFVLS